MKTFQRRKRPNFKACTGHVDTLHMANKTRVEWKLKTLSTKILNFIREMVLKNNKDSNICSILLTFHK